MIDDSPTKTLNIKNQGKSREMTSSWTSVTNQETIYPIIGASWQNNGTSGYNKKHVFSWEKT
jgi:hypothetical protein